MLSDLRKYISKAIKLGEDGQVLKFFCEHCLDKRFSDMLLNDLLDAAISNDFDCQDDIFFLDRLAFNFHLEDYLNSEYNLYPFLSLILKCIVNDPIIDIKWGCPIHFMVNHYNGDDQDPAISSAIAWLAGSTVSACEEALNVMTNETITEEIFNKKINELSDECEESTLYYIRIEYPESDNGAHYEEFVNAMNMFELEQITDTVFATFYLDFCGDEGERCIDLDKIKLCEMLDLIQDISKESLHNYSQYNAVFSSFGDMLNKNLLIEEIMNIKYSETEVLF